MMASVMIEPHGDDAALFAGLLAARHRPRIVTVLRSNVERDFETARAAGYLGCVHEQWPFIETDPPWPLIEERIVACAAVFERAFAPAPEAGGHGHHNHVGRLVVDAFGDDRVTQYLTYVRGAARSAWGVRVEPGPGELSRKLAAVACFESQIEQPSTREWFIGGQDEYIAA